ncbi:MAG: PKD domain-containing protein [Bacteroidota bacterium]
MKRLILLLYVLGGLCSYVMAQPPNDNCVDAINIPVPGNGYGYGLVVADTVDISQATAQTSLGETFPAGVPNGVSVWYRFSLATTREVVILLEQDSTLLNPGDAGWTLYQSNSCYPDQIDRIDPPIFNIEGFTHACLRAGDYLIQIGANPPVPYAGPRNLILSLDFQPSSAIENAYDFASDPLNFQIVSGYNNTPSTYEVGCQSVFDGERLCPDSTYTKSTWHTFTTDNLVDYIRFFARELPFDGTNTTPREFGYNLYQGDISQDSTGLPLIDSCEILRQTSTSVYEAVFYPCQLQPNTTYSIQLLFPTEYFGNIEVGVGEYGFQSTNGPDPATLPTSNQLGLLNAIGTYSVSDYFSCNGLMSNYTCGTLMPDTVMVGNTDYELNWWVTFEIGVEQNINLSMGYLYSQPNPYIRLFAGDVTTDCNLSIITEGIASTPMAVPCLAPGTYSVQVLGQINAPAWPYFTTNLGNTATLNVEITQQNFNSYTLGTTTDIDSINGLNPLVAGTTYQGGANAVDCQTTIMPAGDSCGDNDRAMYRVFYVNQDGYVRISDGTWPYLSYKLFRGNASTSPVVNGQIQGLVDQACCQSLYYFSPIKVCVTPGYYTLVTYADSIDIQRVDQPNIRFDILPPAQFTDPLNPEVMDTLALTAASISATPATFTCLNNPMDILGNAPCPNATKQAYREFYLADSASMRFINQDAPTLWSDGNIRYRLFRGRVSDGSVSALVRDCFVNFTMSACDFYGPGWYTVVAYGTGETFTNPTYCTTRGGSIGDQTAFTISINPPYQEPRFNTFLKAEQVNGTFPLTWAPRYNLGHTDTIPKNDTTYTLGTEYFNCENDLPFPTGIVSCNPSENRVSYRVFTLTQDAYIRIASLGGYNHRLYEGDITSLAPPYTLNEDCFPGDFWKCMSPGTYTLVTFATDAAAGASLTPIVYIDSSGTSRYDHASAAYNFGNIPLNGTEYLGAAGSGLDALGRPESNDFIFCSTSAQATDPASTCRLGAQSLPYSTMASDPRQNLWYTFEVTGPGSIDLTVYPLTPGKVTTLPFAVYRVTNNNYPLTDSTLSDLELITTSYVNYYCNHTPTVNIFRDPCAGVTTDRYVILVDRNAKFNTAAYWPNMQVQVGVRFSNIPGTSVLYDHFSQANLISGFPTDDCTAPYQDTTLRAGTFSGCEGNLTCATKDATDQNTCGDKTIWYKLNVESGGLMRINYTRTDNGFTGYNANDIQLYRQIIPGDSSATGIQRIPLSQVYLNTNDSISGYNFWGESCYTEGTYYIMITGCNFPNATVYPNVWLENYPGDFCYDSLGITIPGSGTYQSTGVVNCWSIGEGPGENLPNLGCAGSPIGKKSGWFHVNISSTDKLDLDISLTENTTATSLQVSYRVANGTCNLMNFENCVDDAFITLNLKCRQDSGLWIQVLLPEAATGDVTLNIDASISPDQSCEPINPFAPNASFDFVAACEDEVVTFTNQSSVGDSLSYLWDFGDGFTSTFLNPTHIYATPDTYLVKLYVYYDNLVDSSIRAVTIFPIPTAGFSAPDTVVAGNPFTIINTSSNSISAATYYWEFCANNSFCSASSPNYSGETPPAITYDIPGTYQICMTMGNGNCYDTLCQTIVVQTLNYYAGGPYDGTDQGYDENCQELNFFTGGPYDGADSDRDNTLCTPINFYTGGPYDGAADGLNDTACVIPMASIFAGGPYDGEGNDDILLACPVQSIWAGGPLDGEGTATLAANCEEINFFTGGPYDGSDQDLDESACAIPNFFTGGPYDGADKIQDDTPCNTINFFTGGPYDGSDRLQNGYGSLSLNNLLLCLGDTAILQSTGLTNWFPTLTSAIPIAVNIDSLILANINQTTQVYVEDGCGGTGRTPATVHVIDTLGLDYATTINCAQTISFFANQTLMAGASDQKVNTELVAFGSQGQAASFNQITCSGASYSNFSRLNDNLSNAAVTFNNTAAGTVWIQWQFFDPQSVDRIELWQDPAYPSKFATEGRLYYSDGGPWVLTKVFSVQDLQAAQFDSGPLCETQNKYAQRWKLELEAPEAAAPYLQELRIYANETTTNGLITWDFGDGSPTVNAVNPTHLFPAPGTYDVTMTLPDACGCNNTITRAINVADCNILPFLNQNLEGILVSDEAALLTWQVEGDFSEGIMEKYIAGKWMDIHTFTFNEQDTYNYVDDQLIYGQDNIYRMRVQTESEEVFSNQISLYAEIENVQVGIYPNPIVDDMAYLSLRLPESSDVKVDIHNNLGQFIQTIDLGEKAAASVTALDIAELAVGQYFLKVYIGPYPYVFKILIVE